MKVLHIVLLLCISIAPSAVAVHAIRGLRSDDSKKMMKMSHKSHKMAKKSFKSSKETTPTSEVDDCPGFSDGSSETPEGNRTSESPDGSRRMQELTDVQIIFTGLPYSVSRFDVTQVAYFIGRGEPYGGIIDYSFYGRQASITFKIARRLHVCVGNSFRRGLSDDNMLALSEYAKRLLFMHFAATLNIVITFENNQQIRFDNFRVGEAETQGIEPIQMYWWIGSEQCSQSGDTSIYCSDATGTEWYLRSRSDMPNAIDFGW